MKAWIQKNIHYLLIGGILFLFGTAAVIAAVKLNVSQRASSSHSPLEHKTFLMGTAVSEKLYGGNNKIISGIEAEIDSLEHKISWRIPDSVIAGLNESGSAVLDEELSLWLSGTMELAASSKGAFDLTLRPLISLWGIEGDSPKVPSRSDIEKCLSLVGYDRVSMKEREIQLLPGTEIDLGAVGKGIALDVAAEYLKGTEVHAATITVGGSVLTYGDKPDGDWRIALQAPDKSTGEAIGVLSLSGTHYISTSGDYEKFFVENGVTYHHIFDSHTGYPADSGLHSVTVLCGNGLLSDGLSTACFVLGYEDSIPLLEQYNAQAVFVFKDGSVYWTEGLNGSFSLVE